MSMVDFGINIAWGTNQMLHNKASGQELYSLPLIRHCLDTSTYNLFKI